MQISLLEFEIFSSRTKSSFDTNKQTELHKLCCKMLQQTLNTCKPKLIIQNYLERPHSKIDGVATVKFNIWTTQ